MKRSPLKRKKLLRGRAPQKLRLARVPRVPLAKRNAARRKKEFARAYGSKERVTWVKSLGCVVCTAISPFIGIATAGTTHNAHTENGGRGRKGDYTTIVPLCYSHHRCYDEHRYPCDGPELRQALRDAAAEVERRWQKHLRASERSERVPKKKEGT